MASPELRVHLAPDLEGAARAAATALTRPDARDPFAPIPVVVAHPQLTRWLRHQVADVVGVAAGLKPLLLTEALDGIAAAALHGGSWVPSTADGLWTPDAVAARLIDLWAAHAHDPALAPIAQMTLGLPEVADHPTVAFAQQVASALLAAARERPEQVVAWARQPDREAPEPTWLRWCAAHLQMHVAGPAAGRAALLGGAPLMIPKGPPVVLVGPSLLADVDARLLRAASTHLEVNLFLPAPAWPGASARLRALTDAHAQRWASAAPAAPLDPAAAPPEPALPPPDGVLAVWQAALRGLPAPPTPPALPSPALHAAWTPLREVEALRDHVLDILHGGANPRDVLILTPDLDTYAPLVQAVFARRPVAPVHPKPSAPTDGGADRAAVGPPEIPVRIGGLGMSSTNPVAAALLHVLDLCLHRITAPGLMQLLRIPVVAARFSIPEVELEHIEALLRDSAARWGADLDEKATVYGDAAPAQLHRHSLRFGLERAALSVVLPDDDPQVAPIVQAPARGLASGFAAPIRDTPDRVGALHTALTALLSARDTLGAAKAPEAEPAPPRAPLAWRELLHALLDDFTEASGARQWLRQEVDEAICSLLPDGQTPRSAAAVRRALQGRFELPAREKPTNNDAVTLARLDPDGVTPAPYIALIGMNSGAFPRVPRWPDWDPRHATLASTAERDPAHDPALRDRHALASAVDGARVGIWISFVGRERLKGAEVPPCVPVAELFDQLPRVQKGPASAGARHPWIPDDLPRWDPELQAAPAPAADPPRASPAPVLDDPSDAPTELTLESLAAALAEPARHLLRARFGIYLPDDKPPLLDREPLEPNDLDKWKLRSQLLARLWERPQGADRPALLLEGAALSAALNDARGALRRALEADGALPPGEVGEAALIAAQESVNNSLNSLRKLTGVGWPQAHHEVQVHHKVSVELEVGHRRVRLVGTVPLCLDLAQVGDRDGHAHLWLLPDTDAEKPKPTLTAWLHLLTARAADEPVRAAAIFAGKKVCFRVCDERPPPSGGNGDVGPDPVSPEGARAQLVDLVQLAEEARQTPLPLFKKTSWAYCEDYYNVSNKAASRGPDQRHLDAASKARGAWDGGERTHAERDDRWVSAALPGWSLDDALAAPPPPDAGASPFTKLAERLWAHAVRARMTDAAGIKHLTRKTTPRGGKR